MVDLTSKSYQEKREERRENESEDGYRRSHRHLRFLTGRF